MNEIVTDNTSNDKKPFVIRYTPPLTLEEALRRREELGASIQQIQSQLGLKQENTEWRKRTKIALLCKIEELRRIKAFLRSQKQNKYEYLIEAIDVLKFLDKSGIDITEKGRNLLEKFSLST